MQLAFGWYNIIELLFCLVALWMGTVSYTHLDVYKRQMRSCRAPSSLASVGW